MAAVNPTDPQSWNRYAYTRNNPLLLVDLLGLCGEPDKTGAHGPTFVEVIGYYPCGNAGSTTKTAARSLTEGDAGAQAQQQSFASCVATGGKIFSLQGMLQFVSGGHLGNGSFSDAFLGNTVSTAIEITQAASSGNLKGAAGAAAPETASRLAGPAATLGANAMPNVVVAVSATQVVATSSSFTVEGFSAALSLKGLAQAGASTLNLTVDALEAPKAVVDVVGAGFGAVICAIMR